MSDSDLYSLPSDLPTPIDDGAADHLEGSLVPNIALRATDGRTYNVAELGRQKTIFFFYPMTGRAEDPVPEGWDSIPGARGCTVQNCAYRDHHARFVELGLKVFGVSVESTDDQREFSEENRIPFPLLSDSEYLWMRASRLPTFEFDRSILMRRFTLFVDQGIVEKVFYPVFPPDSDAETVLSWIRGL